MTLNPYQSPATPPEPPLLPVKKRPSDWWLFLSPFIPLVYFLGTLWLLGLLVIATDWVYMWFKVRS